MSDPGQDLERLRRAFSGSTPSPDSGDCPETDEIWAACRGEISRERIDELLDHALGCDACSEAWSLAREVGAELGQPVPRAGPRSWTRGTLPWIGLAAAAVLVLVLVLPRFTGLGPPPPDAERRAGEERRVESLLGEDPRLPRDAFLLRWSAGPDGSIYSVEVVDAGFDPLDSASDLKQPEYLVPGDRLSALESGSTVRWRVEVFLPDGTRVESRVFRVTLE